MESLLSAVVANRKAFFELVDAIEQKCGCTLDEMELQAEVDSKYHGRDAITEEEARGLMMKVSRPRPETPPAAPPT